MAAEHGTRKEYQRGCRCEPCKDANNVYAQAWNEKHRPVVDKLLSVYQFIDEGNMSWLENARCKGMDTEIFFPTRGDNSLVKQAKEICSTCEVADECLEYALRTNQEIGIWGGRSNRERRSMQRLLKAS
jgi:WhiB family redox-sensing transcriptional regulator